MTIDFEGIVDGTNISTTYSSSGATFTNAFVITSGFSLNEFEFPPASGLNVATDGLGPVTIAFANPVSSFAAYFTYVTTLTLVAYGATNTLVASAESSFAQNFVSSGNAPNELIALSFATGIDYVIITGDPAGGSFVFDNVVFDTGITTTQAPETSTICLLIPGLAAVFALRQNLKKNTKAC